MAHRPEQISRDNITVQMKSISSSILSFTLIWTPPTFLNGELERYEICIGEGEITGIGSCSDPSFCIYLPGSDSDSSMNLVGCTSPGVVSSPDQPTTDIDYHVVVGTDLLFLQVNTAVEPLIMDTPSKGKTSLFTLRQHRSPTITMLCSN